MGGAGRWGFYFFFSFFFSSVSSFLSDEPREGGRDSVVPRERRRGCLSQTEEESDGARATDCLERAKGGGERLFISKAMSNSSGQSGLDRECDLVDERRDEAFRISKLRGIHGELHICVEHHFGL